jgi:hypothetical protein
MIVIAALLIGAAVVVGFFAHQNPGSHDVNLFGYTWTGVYDWVPVAIAAGVVVLICVAALVYAAMRINMLRRANSQLRTENDLLRAVPVTTPAAVTPTGRLVSDSEATGRRSGWYDRGSRRFWWFGGGSKQQRQAARQHQIVRPTDQPVEQPAPWPPVPAARPEQPEQTASYEQPVRAATSPPRTDQN